MLRLTLVELDARTVPATTTWVGPSAGGLWSDARNWDNAAPSRGDDVAVFGSAVASVQDINALTLRQLVFRGSGASVSLTRGITFASAVSDGNVRSESGTNTVTAATGATTATLTATSANVPVLRATSGTLVLTAAVRLASPDPAATFAVAGPGTVKVDAVGTGLAGGLRLLDGTLTGTGEQTGVIVAGGTYSPGGGATARVGAVQFSGGRYAPQASAGGAVDRMVVGRAPDLDGAELVPPSGVPATAVAAITLFENTGLQAAPTRFRDTIEGGTVFAADGRGFTISYTGGRGNDVVLTPLAVGPSAGGGRFVAASTAGLVGYDAAGGVAFTASAPGGFVGGARVAAADLTADGVPEVLAGAGPGGPARVLVLDGVSRAVLADLTAFEASFTGGAFVAAGDLTGDGRPDLVVTPDRGGGPVVAVYDGAALATGTVREVGRFFGIEDANFRGGARPAVGDIDGDGRIDLVVAAGFGGGPRVAIYNGRTVLQPVATGRVPARLFGDDFFVFEESLRNGVFVTAGDLTGDGAAEVVVGGGPGGGPRVFALDGRGLATARRTGVVDLFAGDVNLRGGVRVAVRDGNLVTGSGEGEAAQVRIYTGAAARANQAAAVTLSPFDGAALADGVYVG